MAFAMAPNKKLAVSLRRARDMITLWNAQTWTKQWEVPSSADPIDLRRSGAWVSFSPDSRYLAVGLEFDTCEVWDIWTRKRIRNFQGHTRGVPAVNFSPDGSLLAFASKNGTIRLWDMNVAESSRKDIFTSSLASSPLGTLIATGFSDESIEVRTLESNRLVQMLPGRSSNGIYQVIAISMDDRFLAQGATADRSVRVFDLQSGQLHAIFKNTNPHSLDQTWRLSFRSDGRQIACGGDQGMTDLLDLNTRSRVWQTRVQNDEGGFIKVAFSPKDDLVAWLGPFEFGLLDAISGEKVLECDSAIQSGYTHIAWADDGTQVLTSEWLGVVCVWDVTSARSTKQASLLYKLDILYHTRFFSFFDNHRCIVTDHGIFPILPQHRPPCADGDLVPPSLEILLRLRWDGWIWRVGGGRDEQRVCWLPPAYRPMVLEYNLNIVILQDSVRLVTDTGRLVVLDLMDWL